MEMETEKASSKKRKPPFLQRFFRWAAAAAAAFSLCIGVAGAAAWKLSPDSLTVTGESGTQLQSQWYQVISQPQGMERQASATGSSSGGPDQPAWGRAGEVDLFGIFPGSAPGAGLRYSLRHENGSGRRSSRGHRGYYRQRQKHQPGQGSWAGNRGCDLSGRGKRGLGK